MRAQGRTCDMADISDKLAEEVKNFLLPHSRDKKSVSLTTLANSLGISISTAWRAVWKKLDWYPRNVVPLPEAHKAARVVFSNWLLNQPDWFEEKVIWSDDKWFVLKQKPNQQNEH